MFANSYNGCRVFVTGHTGFKGSWLSIWLESLGATVAGFSDCVPTTPSHYAAGLDAILDQDLRGNIRDRDKLTEAMRSFKPDIVFHLAAQALVRKSYSDPASTFETNVLGTLNVLEAVRACDSVRAVVMITSDKCYRNNEWIWGYRETDHLGGYDPYSASKGCAELVAQSYFHSFFSEGPAAVTVRAGNVIGGGDWAEDRIVPDCARAWSSSKAVSIRSPNATRPWQLVLEPLSGYLWLGACLLQGCHQGINLANRPFDPKAEAYNFGPDAVVNNTVAEVANELTLHWPGFQIVMDTNKTPEQKECTLLKLCCDKALSQLGWKATLDFEETIRYTAEWYRKFYAESSAGYIPNMLDFSKGQIAAYTNAALQRGLIWAQ